MTYLLRSVLAVIRLLFIAILTVLTLLIALPVFHLSGRARGVSYATARYWSRGALFLLNIRVNLRGNIPQTQVLVMPNHQTFLDIFLILAYYPSSIVAKQEIGHWPMIKYAIALGRIILVDRSRLQGALRTMHAIDAEIKSGGSVILFPEGTTHAGPLTKAFKTGSFKIAEETATPVVPVAIRYISRRIFWGDEPFLTHFMQCMGFARTEVDLWFGPAIQGLPYNDLLQATQSAIDAQLSQ